MPAHDIASVVVEMQRRLDVLPAEMQARRYFLSTYLRTTLAVQQTVAGAGFEDPEWVERWDAVFAEFFFAAHDADLAGEPVPRPWRLSFAAPAELPPLRHVLLGMNAHVNYDLPQSLLGVIADEEFEDARRMDQRRRDHERIDGVLASRVGAEDDQLAAVGAKAIVDRLLTPLNRAGSKRFLREARQKVWHNTRELQRARIVGPREYAARLAELEVLSAAKVVELLEPGQVLLRLSVAGFGVVLPPR